MLTYLISSLMLTFMEIKIFVASGIIGTVVSKQIYPY